MLIETSLSQAKFLFVRPSRICKLHYAFQLILFRKTLPRRFVLDKSPEFADILILNIPNHELRYLRIENFCISIL